MTEVKREDISPHCSSRRITHLPSFHLVLTQPTVPSLYPALHDKPACQLLPSSFHPGADRFISNGTALPVYLTSFDLFCDLGSTQSF